MIYVFGNYNSVEDVLPLSHEPVSTALVVADASDPAPLMPPQPISPALAPPFVEAAVSHQKTPVPVDQTLSGERRYLTIRFCDLVGSTSLSAQLDPEELDAVFGRLPADGGVTPSRHESCSRWHTRAKAIPGSTSSLALDGGYSCLPVGLFGARCAEA
jgi:hypothetical protein